MEKRVKAHEVDQLARARVLDAPTETLCHLMNGDLFVWPAQPDYLHRYHGCTYRDGYIDHAWATQVAARVNGGWVPTETCQRTNWNHCCTVVKVKIVVYPE